MTNAKSPLLSVDAAIARLLADVTPLDTHDVPLNAARGRILAAPLVARLTQPPFDASAMDGYAVRAVDVPAAGARLNVIGESAAGRGFTGRIEAGEAVRIFTGAPLPAGADTVVIQEDTARDGDWVMLAERAVRGENVRPTGGDFRAGSILCETGRRLTARHLMLAASAGHANVDVVRRPTVAVLATGDELVPPGTEPGRDQIVSSIPSGLFGMIEAAGGEPILLGIARDTLADLDAKIASAADADVLVTIGGASVGDHDLVHKALTTKGRSLAFWRIAMRPGKPLMFGKLGSQRVLGLPGNPVSAMLCARIFLLPLIRALQGAVAIETPAKGVLAEPVPANGPRQHYMRARIVRSGASMSVAALPRQDSSLLGVLAQADCLIVVPANAPGMAAGTDVDVLLLDD